MKPKYDPMVHALILMGEILPDPESWTDDWFWSVAHCQNLMSRIGVEDYNIIGDDEEGYKVEFKDGGAAMHKLLTAQAHGRDKDGGKLFAGDFGLLGQLTGYTL